MIADPELAGGGGGSARGADGDEAIADPELSGGGSSQTGFEEDYGWGAVYTPKTRSQGKAPPPEPEEDEYDPLANTGIGKLDIIGQQVFDTKHDRQNILEDFYETRLRFGGEVDLRVSRKLRLAFGTRLDFQWAAPHQNDPSLKITSYVSNPADPDGPPLPRTRAYTVLEQDRYEVDIIPLAAYADWTAGEGVHVRLGIQPVSLGRMDGFSVVDMLAVLDFRPAPHVDPAALKLAQTAIRVDWDLGTWATLQAVYVPWFMPHLMRGNRDLYQQDSLFGPGLNDVNLGSAEFLDPSYQTLASEDVFRLVGPTPDFSSPQVEARLNFRGSSFEVALLGGTALEKYPAIYYIPVLDQLLRVNTGSGPPPVGVDPVEVLTPLVFQLGEAVYGGSPIIDVEYPRYSLVGLDGSFDIAPVQIGFEFGYSPGRLLYAASTTGASLPLPNVSQQICNPNQAGTPCADPELEGKGNVTNRKIRKGVPMVLGALHLEWLKGESFAFVGEAYFAQALESPYDTSRTWLGSIGKTGLFAGGLATAIYRPDEGRWHLELSALLAPGPSALIAPHVELRVVEGFYLNVGAQFYTEGEPITMSPGFAPRNITVGGLFNRYDNAYLGFRWLP